MWQKKRQWIWPGFRTLSYDEIDWGSSVSQSSREQTVRGRENLHTNSLTANWKFWWLNNRLKVVRNIPVLQGLPGFVKFPLMVEFLVRWTSVVTDSLNPRIKSTDLTHTHVFCLKIRCESSDYRFSVNIHLSSILVYELVLLSSSIRTINNKPPGFPFKITPS